jgi:hypothetical protein
MDELLCSIRTMLEKPHVSHRWWWWFYAANDLQWACRYLRYITTITFNLLKLQRRALEAHVFWLTPWTGHGKILLGLCHNHAHSSTMFGPLCDHHSIWWYELLGEAMNLSMVAHARGCVFKTLLTSHAGLMKSIVGDRVCIKWCGNQEFVSTRSFYRHGLVKVIYGGYGV